MALGAQRREVLAAALGRPVKCWRRVDGGVVLGILAGKVLAYIVYQANAHDPLVLTGVVLAMALLAGSHVDSGAAGAVCESAGAAAEE